MCHAQGVERTKLGFIVGRIERERPVHASRARLWETIQSTEPLRWTTAKDVLGFRTETRAVTGLAEETYPPVLSVIIRVTTKIYKIPRTDFLVEKWYADGSSSDGL